MKCLVCGEPSSVDRVHGDAIRLSNGGSMTISCLDIFEFWWPTIAVETPCKIIKRIDPEVVKQRLRVEGRGFDGRWMGFHSTSKSVFMDGMPSTSVTAKIHVVDAPLIPALVGAIGGKRR